jgi:hypothetical protein
VDQTFHEEIINYGRSRSHMLNMAHFKDDSSPDGIYFLLGEVIILVKTLFMMIIVMCWTAWDYSAWVRTYALFLEERLECFRVLKYDVEMDRPVRTYLFTVTHLGSQFIKDFLIEILVTVHYFNHFTTLNTIMWTLAHLSNHIYKFDFFFYLGINFFWFYKT